MTAICGLVSTDPDPRFIASTLQSMVKALQLHPGVGMEHASTWRSGGFASYQQYPLHDANADRRRCIHQDGELVVVCTAELYNGHIWTYDFREQFNPYGAEAGLIAALYRRYGEGCVERMEGPLAFALWDESQERLLLATDRFSIRPLLYFATPDSLIFASNIGSIRKVLAHKAEIDLDSIYQYLYFSCVPSPQTIYRDVKKLPSGHYLSWSPAGLRLHQYWTLDYTEDYSRPAEYFASSIRRSLTDAVRSQATYDNGSTALGAFLSGGTDSSVISGLLGEAIAAPAKTFSIGFSENGFNEIRYARIAARHFNTHHHEYFVTPEDAAAAIPKLVRAYDEPFGNASAIASYYCAELARQNGVQILLAGDGGDELFGGNSRYAADKVFDLYRCLPLGVRQQFLEPLLHNWLLPNVSIIQKARNYIRRSNIPQPKRFLSYHLFYTIDVREIFTDDFLGSISADPGLSVATDHFCSAAAESTLNRLLYLDLKIAIADNDLRKVTRTADLAKVQVRYPMLDLTLVNLSGKIPASMKLKGFSKRYIYKQAFRKYLPREILIKKKHGFGLPISLWLRGIPPLHQLTRDTLMSRSSLQRGYFKRQFLERLIKLHRDDRTNFFGDNIWTFLMLELWHQHHAES